MPSLPASRIVILAALAALPVMAAGLPALAQSPAGQPMQLGPPGKPSLPEPGPVTPTVLKVLPSPALEPLPAQPALAETRFQMEELKAPDLEGIGILDEKQGGLGPAMWNGTPARLVRHYLPQMPAVPASRTLRQLSRRLLLSAGAAPEGGKGQTPSLVELRAERLYAMGEIEGLAALLKTTPASLSSPGLARLKMDAFLLAGDTKAACAEAAALMGNLDNRMQVFCMLTAGKVLEANMALDLMRERKDADHAFIAAAEAMAGTPPAKVDKLPNPTPLHLAAFKAAKLNLPADAANASHPVLLKAIAEGAGLPVELRITAAEKAEAMGVLDTDSVRKMYAAVAFTPAEQQAAMGLGDKTPRSRVLLLRAAQQEQVASVKAELISRILAAAADRGALAATARLYAPVMAELKPNPDLAPYAAQLARAFYAAGRPEAAGGWLTLAKSDPAQAKAVEDLWLLARLYRMGEGAPTPPETYSAWVAARELPADRAERRALAGFELLQAVGEKLPNTEWLSIPHGPQAASTAIHATPAVLKAQLRAAAEGVRVGETVLLALAALGERGLEKADPDTLNRVVVFLRMAGLEREARDLAVEAALANGI